MELTFDQLAQVIATCLDSPTEDGKCRFSRRCEYLEIDTAKSCPENKDYIKCPGYRAHLIVDLIENETIEAP